MQSEIRKSVIRRLGVLAAAIGLFIGFGMPAARAADIELSGTCSWSISGTSIDLSAGKVANKSSSGTSGTVRLRVWATSSPYSGGTISGYVLGTRTLGTLSAGYSYNNVSGYVTYSAPPDGTYYTTMTAEEYTGSGYVIRDYLTFTGTSVFGSGGGGGGGGGGDLAIEGTGSWKISGSSIIIGADKVSNNRSGGSSGSLRLQVWATSYPYSGGSMSGYVIGTYSLGTLSGGYYYSNLSGTVSFKAPPAGTYYTTLTLEEYDGGSYSIVDYIAFSGTSVFGGGGGGGGGGDLDLSGTVAYNIKGSNCNLKAEKVSNNRDGGTSGTLRLRLWATKSRYKGGSITGYVVATRRLGQLQGGYYYSDIKGKVPVKRPPGGSYYMTMALEEYSGGRYYIVDYINFSNKQSF